MESFAKRAPVRSRRTRAAVRPLGEHEPDLLVRDEEVQRKGEAGLVETHSRESHERPADEEMREVAVARVDVHDQRSAGPVAVAPVDVAADQRRAVRGRAPRRDEHRRSPGEGEERAQHFDRLDAESGGHARDLVVETALLVARPDPRPQREEHAVL